MKLAASIELLWQMATHEAIAGEFREIEPEHFLAAMLKFAELPVEDLDKLAPGVNVAKELTAEVLKVCQELQGRSIDSTQKRRELRAHLGKGGAPHDGGQKHRSKTCRDLFDAAARLADDANSEALAAEHLLAALLVSPTPLMREVLGNGLGRKAAGPAEAPLADQYGQDLLRMAAEKGLSASPQRAAQCKVLVQLLVDSQHPGVLLVSANRESARAVVMAAAGRLASAECPPKLKGKRIVDVAVLPPGFEEISREHLLRRERELNDVIAGASTARDVILFAELLETTRSLNEPPPAWADCLRERLAAGTAQCILYVTPAAYERWIKKNREWKRMAQVMWVADKGSGDIPVEL